MAKVSGLPVKDIIRAFKGTLDFYVYRGIYCVRAWPRLPAMPRSIPSQQSAAIWAAFSKEIGETDFDIIALATQQAGNTGYTWKDLLTSAAYNHLIEW